MAGEKGKTAVSEADVAYRVHSYATVMGSLRDDGVCIGEREVLAKVREMVRGSNPPCEIHLTLQTK